MTLKQKFEHYVIYCPACKFHIKPEVKESQDKENTVIFCKDCNTVFARIKRVENESEKN